MDYCDPMIAGSGDVDRRVTGPVEAMSLRWEGVDDDAGQWGSLTHEHRRCQKGSNDQSRHLGRQGGSEYAISARSRIATNRRVKRHVLVVVQNSDLVFLHWPDPAVI